LTSDIAIKRYYHEEIKRHFRGIFFSHQEKKDGMKNYGFIAISFYGNMFLLQYG
jgi:hypothetical protein